MVQFLIINRAFGLFLFGVDTMPQRPKRPCRHPGCPALVESSYCDKHKKQDARRYDQQRGSANKRGYTYRWQRYRKYFLAHNPLCCECERQGMIKPATDVDHIQAVSGPSDPLFWEPSNHQALCHSCHSEKTAKEDGGFGNGRY